MKRFIENNIGNAIKFIKEEKLSNDNGEIPQEFKGYISSFGTTVLQCGLIPAVALFSNTTGQSKDKIKILNIINKIAFSDNKETLLKKVVDLKDERSELLAVEEKIIAASIALKLAIRTFKFTEENIQNN
jgi:CRISPR-associated protein Cmr5